MARKFISYKAGSPERAVQDAVDERYGGNNEAFFSALAERLKIRSDSAGSTYYKVLAKGVGFPSSHRAAYEALLELPPSTLDRLGRKPLPRSAADPLAKLRVEVADHRTSLLLLLDLSGLLAEQVVKLGGQVPQKTLDALRQAAAGTRA